MLVTLMQPALLRPSRVLFSFDIMSASPNPPTPPHPPSGKRKRSVSGWATRKARDARRQAEYYEGKQALEAEG